MGLSKLPMMLNYKLQPQPSSDESTWYPPTGAEQMYKALSYPIQPGSASAIQQNKTCANP